MNVHARLKPQEEGTCIVADEQHPNEGEGEYQEDLFRDFTHNVMELCVHIGLFNTVAGHWPAQVQANWTERMQRMIEWVNQQIEEVQMFAEAFDGEEE